MDIQKQLGDIKIDIFRAIASLNHFEEYHPPGASDAYQELIKFSKLLESKNMTRADTNIYLFNLHSLHRFLTRYKEEKCDQYGFLRTADQVRTEIEKKFIEWAGGTEEIEEIIKEWISWAERAYSMFGSSATWLKGLDRSSCITVRTMYRAKAEVRSKMTQWVKEALISHPPPLPSSPLSPPPLSDSTSSPSITFEELSSVPSPLPTPDLDMEWVQEVPPAIIETPQAPLYHMELPMCVPQQQQHLTYLENFPGALLDSCINHPETDRISVDEAFSNAPVALANASSSFCSSPRVPMINLKPFVYKINSKFFYPIRCSNSSSVCWDMYGCSCPLAHPDP